MIQVTTIHCLFRTTGTPRRWGYENSPHSSSPSTESERGEAGIVGSGPSLEDLAAVDVAELKTVLPGAGGGERAPKDPKDLSGLDPSLLDAPFPGIGILSLSPSLRVRSFSLTTT